MVTLAKTPISGEPASMFSQTPKVRKSVSTVSVCVVARCRLLGIGSHTPIRQVVLVFGRQRLKSRMRFSCTLDRTCVSDVSAAEFIAQGYR